MHTDHTLFTPQLSVTERLFVQRFSATRRGARLARLLAVQQLDTWGFPYGGELSETAAVVVAELASNAVRHGRVAGRDFELAVTWPAFAADDAVLIEVSDTRGDAYPPAQCPDTPGPDEESGRGLLLVSALSDAWGVRARQPTAPGKTVWARLTV